MSGLNYHFQPAIKVLIIFSPWRALQWLHFPIARNMKALLWRHYSEMKRWRHYSIFIFFYYTWRNDLRLYNRMTLSTIIIMIITIMFIYSGINFILDPRILICRAPVSFVPSVLRRTQMTLSVGKSKSAASNGNNALRMNIIVILCNKKS